METKTYHTMDYYELDQLVSKYFPSSGFNFVADEEMHNDSEKDMGNISKKDYEKWNDSTWKDFNEIILGKKSPMWNTYLFLEYFVGNDILPEGNYLITVCW